MKSFLKHLFALHVSLAYLSMITGVGMLLFTGAFLYLLFNVSGLPALLYGLLVYVTFILGPGAILLAVKFYQKMQRIK